MGNIKKKILISRFFFFLFTTLILAQPGAKYRPFDWLLFKEPGRINSLSEGYEYLYIATSHGGIYRYSLYSNQYDFPITSAQGLQNNNITSVHFDHNTGIIWASSSGFLEYSYTREGDWRQIKFVELGLNSNDRIKRIGNSENYVWAQANAVYIKMDKSSGILAGIYPMPDELNIKWSSGPYLMQNEVSDVVNNYTIMSGWMVSGSQFIDNYGRYIDITSGLVGSHNDVWIGSSDGTLFHGNKTMAAIFPTEFGIRGSNIDALSLEENNLWIGSKDYEITRGITRLNTRNFQADHYDFDITVNMNLTEVRSIFNFDSDLWLGGNGVVLVFDKDDNYWRTLGQDRGIPDSDITSMVGDSNYVWIGSYYGIRQIDRRSKREEPMGFEYLFNNHPVYDLCINDYGVWIASRTGIYLYDKNNPQIMNALSLGISYLDFPVSRVTSIFQKKNILYFATNIGIVTFDMSEEVWDMLISVAEYRGLDVSDMSVIGNFCFIATEQGLFRINMKSHRVREYNFEFIGSVNTIKHFDKFIWIGTSEGLIRFKWRKDL
jgi:ligand-binding sensor domain-containing protein